MKHFKKFFSYLVALTMVLSLAAFTGVKVHAEGTTYTLTLSDTSTGHTYEAYQVFTGDLNKEKNSEGKEVKVLSNVKWGTGINSSKEADLINALKSDDTLKDKFGNVTDAASVAKALEDVASNSAEMDAFAQVIGKYLSTPSQSSSGNEIKGLAAGYYLVKDKDGSQKDKPDAYTKFIGNVVGDTTAAIKSGVPTVEKKVQDTNDSTGETSNWQDSADADIGDDVQYQITGTMPDNIADYTTYKYTFTDTMSKGLTYNSDAKITIGNTDVTGSFTPTVKTNDDKSTTVTWACDDLKGISGVTLDKDTKVVVAYSANLNKDAVIGSAGNPNEVNLTYSNNPNKGGEGETGTTPKDKNIVFTYKTVVNKFDQDGKTRLKGAGFTLKKKVKNAADKVVKTFTAGEETTFEFTGLDDGDYELSETTTPAGYNTITPIKFTISAEHDTESDEPKLTDLSGNVSSGEATFTANTSAGSLTTDVVNKKGSTLPSTGGMGTTLLYVAGGILVACAAAYVVLNKKRA